MPSPDRLGPLRIRAIAIMVVVVCLFATIFGRLWYLQIVEAHTTAVRQVASQGLETIYLPAPRGDIFTRDGMLLAGNHIEDVVQVAPDAVQEHPSIVNELAAALDEPISQVKTALANPQYSPYQPVPVAEGVSSSVALSIEENQKLMPGVSVAVEPVRYYPQWSTTANIVGYVSQITGSEYDTYKNEICGKDLPCYTTTSQVGQAGVEASVERYLRGVPGNELVEVNTQGQVLGVASYTPPVPGDNVVLSISFADQKAAVADLNYWVQRGRTFTDPASGRLARVPEAAMVAQDPRNGQVLALATYPDYNDNDFLGGISYKKWDYYNNPSNNYPLENRAISWAGASGSTFKLITATAALDYGIRSPYYLYNDTGSITVGGQTFHDNANLAAGPVDLQTAITISDDAYFYSLGYDFWQMWANQKDHPEYLQKIASEYGLGRYSGIALPGEAPGIVPSQEVFTRQHQQYPSAYPSSYFEPGQEIQEAIGQGEDEVTPLQLANAYSAFANGGTLYSPGIVLAVESPGKGNRPNGKILRLFHPQVKGQVQMPSAADRAAMISGFQGVTSAPSGTAFGAFQGFPLSKFPVAGKTGTAQVGPDYSVVGWPKYIQDTSVFSSFAPASAPRFVVDAFFAQAGYGASVAAPAVCQEYLTLFGILKPAKGGHQTTISACATTVSGGAT